MQSSTEWLRPDQMVVGDVYELDSRRQRYGRVDRPFVGIQWEFDERCLFHEDHWDQGGSAKPLTKIATLPGYIEPLARTGSGDNRQLFNWLIDLEAQDSA